MPAPPTSPTCTCGYDLSGLPGPPWSCPECAQITRFWPPDPPPPTLAAGDRLAIAIWFFGLLISSRLDDGSVEMRRVAFVGLVTCSGLGAIVIAFVLSQFVRKEAFVLLWLTRLGIFLWVLIVSVVVFEFVRPHWMH